MKIDISRLLREKGGTLALSYEEEGFPLEVEGQEVRFTSPIKVEGVLTNTGRFIIGNGRLQTRVQLTCDRCLRNYEEHLDLPWELTFRKAENGETASTEEGDLIYFSDEEIDLTDPLQEEILLALPIRRLCREDCPGLCPVCGADRATTPCSCQVEEVDPRLAVLEKLLPKDLVGNPLRGGGKDGKSEA